MEVRSEDHASPDQQASASPEFSESRGIFSRVSKKTKIALAGLLALGANILNFDSNAVKPENTTPNSSNTPPSIQRGSEDLPRNPAEVIIKTLEHKIENEKNGTGVSGVIGEGPRVHKLEQMKKIVEQQSEARN